MKQVDKVGSCLSSPIDMFTHLAQRRLHTVREGAGVVVVIAIAREKHQGAGTAERLAQRVQYLRM